jgi:hypothetical protein
LNVDPAGLIVSVAELDSLTVFGKTTVVEVLSLPAPVSGTGTVKIEPAALMVSEALPFSFSRPPGVNVEAV